MSWQILMYVQLRLAYVGSSMAVPKTSRHCRRRTKAFVDSTADWMGSAAAWGWGICWSAMAYAMARGQSEAGTTPEASRGTTSLLTPSSDHVVHDMGLWLSPLVRRTLNLVIPDRERSLPRPTPFWLRYPTVNESNPAGASVTSAGCLGCSRRGWFEADSPRGTSPSYVRR